MLCICIHLFCILDVELGMSRLVVVIQIAAALGTNTCIQCAGRCQHDMFLTLPSQSWFANVLVRRYQETGSHVCCGKSFLCHVVVTRLFEILWCALSKVLCLDSYTWYCLVAKRRLEGQQQRSWIWIMNVFTRHLIVLSMLCDFGRISHFWMSLSLCNMCDCVLVEIGSDQYWSCSCFADLYWFLDWSPVRSAVQLPLFSQLNSVCFGSRL